MIVTGTTFEHVRAAPGIGPVVAVAPVERVGAAPAPKEVPTVVAGHSVDAAAAEDQIAPARAGESVVSGSAEHEIALVRSGEDVIPRGSVERLRESDRDGDQRRDDRDENDGSRHARAPFRDEPFETNHTS